MTPSVRVVEATAADLTELADVAAATFPLACPPSVDSANVAEFIAANLSLERFGDYLDDPDRAILIVRDSQRITGYAILIRGTGDDESVNLAVTTRPAVELSKLYVVVGQHGAGASSALMAAAIEWAGETGARSLWLGVNQQNQRAQRFYLKHGFTIAGTKMFQLGTHSEDDFVMVRPL